MARYKKYKYGGKRIPGMFKKQEGGDMPVEMKRTESLSPDESMINTVNIQNGDTTRTSRPNPYHRSMLQNLAMSNAIKNNQAKQAAKVNMQMQEAVMEIKLQNQALEQQNNLLKTQIQKMDLINSARNTKQSPGMKTTPKKRGGSIKAKKGKEKKMIMFAQSSGGTMKHGGSCGGPLMSMMKKRKRR